MKRVEKKLKMKSRKVRVNMYNVDNNELNKIRDKGNII